MHSLTKKIPRVAVLLSSSYPDHLKVLRGILRFTQLNTPWAMDVRMGRAGEPTSFDPKGRNFDGLITNRMTDDLAALIDRHRIPVITVNDIWPQGRPLARIACDNVPIAKMAAGHLIERGFTEFAFVGERSGLWWSLERAELFAKEVAKHGFVCREYPGENDNGDPKTLRDWLSRLPRGTAVFAAYDIRARQILDACMEAGLDVPDDIAILGVDDDELICETATPSLSSISMSTEEAGFKAAEIMNRAIASGWRPRETLNISFTGHKLVDRRSTARNLHQDILVRRCRELMDANFGHPFNVSDLVSHLKVSRRTLETHFRNVTGRTLNAEITDLKLQHAKTLLARTGMTQARIAAQCGFSDASHMNVVFRRRYGAPPSAFRRDGEAKN
jgi:LacI family transcriptional regulator